MLFCLVISIILTLLLEAIHYLTIDIIKYTQIFIILLIVLSIAIVYVTSSEYYGVILGYLDFMIIRDLLKTYQMNHLLEKFKK